MRGFTITGLGLLLALLGAARAIAQTPAEAGIVVEDGWARASVTPAATVGSAYFSLQNLLQSPVVLTAAHSARAETVELHTHTMADGVMQMRKLDSLSVGAGETVQFEPGGNHLMLIGLNGPLEKDEHFEVILTLCLDKVPEKHCQEKTVEMLVRDAGAM